MTRGIVTLPFVAYSTALGSPVADTTGGTFRFTCDATQAPCEVAVRAAALSDSAGTVRFYPRVNMSKDGDPDIGIQPRTYCEYGDGTGGPGGISTLTKQPKSATPNYEPMQLSIGSDDCGLGGPGGVVDSIVVPKGFYNVDASFAFFS